MSSSEKFTDLPFGKVALYTVLVRPDLVTTSEPLTVKKL